jgi:uncharacterized membrane protein YdbT with pleckstrin-like domain
MSYIENNLIKDEEVITKTNIHWSIFLPAAAILALGICRLISVHAGQFLLLIGVGLVAGAYITYKTSEFGITNKRIIGKAGLIKRKSLEIMLTKVEGISVKQSILGRILGYGDVTVNGIGSTKESFSGIPNPIRFRKILQNELDRVGS